MAKINHNNHLDTIDNLFTDAKNKGVLHIKSQAGHVAGRKIQIGETERLNFGSLGYMALETDQRLIDGAIDFAKQYGTQSVMSRTYITTSIIEELEDTLSQLFKAPVLAYSRVSTAHVSLIPTLIGREDAIILDQQCHFSMQTAAQLQRQKGVTIEMIKHNNLEMLENKLKELGNTHQKIWYLADGVYSMFGDLAPLNELIALIEKYPQLWVYIDDAHGMSWKGPNGSGYVKDVIDHHDQIILVTTMSKGFGVHGGIAVFPSQELHRKVKVFGGPLSYSLPLSPADIGACLASAKIHLSDEIHTMQHELLENIQYCNSLLEQSNLPVISNPETPIYFIGMGQPQTGYNMVSRLLNEGIYINPSFFPMVPVKSTGLRFGLTRNHKQEDIKQLINAIEFHFPLALEEEGKTRAQIHRAFRLAPPTEIEKNDATNTSLKLEYSNTIEDVNHRDWDNCMKDLGTINVEGMRFMEAAFSNNPKEEENWRFHYFVVKEGREVIVSTFLIEGLFKDDFLSDPSISQQIEKKRQEDPNYLVSKSLLSGSTISEGQHVFVNKVHPKWKRALQLFLEKATELKERVKAEKVILGEFLSSDNELNDFFHSKGFFKVDMPDMNVIPLDWDKFEDLLYRLSKTRRQNVKREALKLKDCFEVEVKTELNKEEVHEYYKLFLNVKQKNLGLNFFDYPRKILEVMSRFSSWEFIILYLKKEHDTREERKAIAALWCFKGVKHYSAMIIGMDYDFNDTYKVYKQALYRTVLRAKELGKEKIYMGYSADTEKKKYGAIQVPKVVYVQADDNFKMDLIQSMGV